MTPFDRIPKNVLWKALARIRRTNGYVCDEFELCTHRACMSSYDSWAIATMALNYDESDTYPFDSEPVYYGNG